MNRFFLILGYMLKWFCIAGGYLIMKKSCCSEDIKGFTLIELLVVVLIIGILAAIALPQYQKAVEKSRYAAMLSVMDSLIKAQQHYYLVNSTYATSFDQLDFPPAQQALPAGEACPNWNALENRQIGNVCATMVSSSSLGNGSMRVTYPYQGTYNATKAKKAARTGYYYVLKKAYTLPQAGLYCVRSSEDSSGPCTGTRVMNNDWGQWYKI